MATDMGTKTDRIIWYTIAFIAFAWASLAFIQDRASFIHILAFIFGASCIFQPARNAKKRAKLQQKADDEELRQLQLKELREKHKA